MNLPFENLWHLPIFGHVSQLLTNFHLLPEVHKEVIQRSLNVQKCPEKCTMFISKTVSLIPKLNE